MFLRPVVRLIRCTTPSFSHRELQTCLGESLEHSLKPTPKTASATSRRACHGPPEKLAQDQQLEEEAPEAAGRTRGRACDGPGKLAQNQQRNAELSGIADRTGGGKVARGAGLVDGVVVENVAEGTDFAGRPGGEVADDAGLVAGRANELAMGERADVVAGREGEKVEGRGSGQGSGKGMGRGKADEHDLIPPFPSPKTPLRIPLASIEARQLNVPADVANCASGKQGDQATRKQGDQANRKQGDQATGKLAEGTHPAQAAALALGMLEPWEERYFSTIALRSKKPALRTDAGGFVVGGGSAQGVVGVGPHPRGRRGDLGANAVMGLCVGDSSNSLEMRLPGTQVEAPGTGESVAAKIARKVDAVGAPGTTSEEIAMQLWPLDSPLVASAGLEREIRRGRATLDGELRRGGRPASFEELAEALLSTEHRSAGFEGALKRVGRPLVSSLGSSAGLESELRRRGQPASFEELAEAFSSAEHKSLFEHDIFAWVSSKSSPVGVSDPVGVGASVGVSSPATVSSPVGSGGSVDVGADSPTAREAHRGEGEGAGEGGGGVRRQRGASVENISVEVQTDVAYYTVLNSTESSGLNGAGSYTCGRSRDQPWMGLLDGGGKNPSVVVVGEFAFFEANGNGEPSTDHRPLTGTTSTSRSPSKGTSTSRSPLTGTSTSRSPCTDITTSRNPATGALISRKPPTCTPKKSRTGYLKNAPGELKDDVFVYDEDQLSREIEAARSPERGERKRSSVPKGVSTPRGGGGARDAERLKALQESGVGFLCNAAKLDGGMFKLGRQKGFGGCSVIHALKMRKSAHQRAVDVFTEGSGLVVKVVSQVGGPW